MLEIERTRHHLYYHLELIRCYPTPRQQGGTVAWMLEGQAEGPGRWTDEEIAQVNLLLSQYPQPRYQFGTTYWYLWKKPAASIDSDQRPTYAIDKAVASQVDYVRALHDHDLAQLLRSWAAMQQNGEDAQAHNISAYIDELFAAPSEQLQQMLTIIQERGTGDEG